MEKDSLVFNQLSNYLKDSPINEDTQLKIERFLLDFSYITYEKKKDSNTPIDYSLISNNLTKYLKSNETILNSYIDNIRRKTFNKEPSNQNELVIYRLNIILKEIDNPLIISIIYGRLLRIVSNFNRLNLDNKATDVFFDIGKDIVRNFFYSLYSKHIIEYIKLFLKQCDIFLNKNNSIETDSIKFTLDKIKKLIKKSDKSDLVFYTKDLVLKIKSCCANNKHSINLNDMDKTVNYTLSE